MIRLKRPEPPRKFLRRAERLRDEVLRVIEADPEQLRWVLPKGARVRREARPALEAASHDKCAYCETRIGPGSIGDIERYRPKGGVHEEDGDFPLHYAWLAFEWDNLCLSCTRCNRLGKRNRFPISGERAAIGAFGADLEREEPVLLNPFEDDPSEHLHFMENGLVHGMTPSGNRTERGERTIEILGLNRESLVESRQKQASAVLEIVDRIRELGEAGNPGPPLTALIDQLRQATQDDAEYAGMARQLTDRYLGSILEKGGFAGAEEFRKKKVSRKNQFLRFSRAFRGVQSYSLEGREEASEEALADYRALVRQIESIRVKNLKALRDVRIDVPRFAEAPPGTDGAEAQSSAPRRAPWTMILGENATGKSTLLKLIALTLIGEDYQKHLQGDPRTYVRQGCKRGNVKVKLTGIRRAHQLTYETSGEVSDSGQLRGQTLVLAYGTTRLLTKGETEGFGARYARVDNLFDSRVPLIDVDKWLRELREAEPLKFDGARKALGRVLLFEDNEDLFWDEEAGGLKVRLKDAVVTLDQLSDGYHAVLSLVADILSVLLQGWPTPQRAEGVVLIDELGTHLHPTWRMQLVERLREVLPRVQFIATTHDPLCLRGLEDGEVVVVVRNARGHVHSLSDLPPVKALRVDQLLTSEHFGLSSTLDPRSERFFKDYYALLAKADRDEEDERKLAAMRKELPRHGLPGATRRERLMLEAIDFYLAVEPELEGEKRRRASQQALSDVLGRILEKSAR